jgi:hypothetical protein
MAPECGKISATKKYLNYPHSQDHPGEKRNRSIMAFQESFPRTESGRRKEKRIPEQRSFDKAGQQLPGEEIIEVRRYEERGPRTRLNPLQPIPNK